MSEEDAYQIRAAVAHHIVNNYDLIQLKAIAFEYEFDNLAYYSDKEIRKIYKETAEGKEDG